MYKDNQIWQRLWFSLCFCIILGLALPAQSVYAQDAYYQLSSSAQSIVASINQMRANAGLSPLQVNSLLTNAAQGHATDMANNQVYGHTGSDGSNVRIRVRRTGYAGDWIGENWVLTSTPEQAMQWWMADPPHAQNILQPNFSEIGIGEVRDPRTGLVFWVTDFARGGAGAVVYEQSAVEQAVATQETIGSTVNVQTIPAEGLDYTVRAGDTLLAIGLRHNMAWQEIATINGLSDLSLLQVGQTIRLPGQGGVGGPVTTFDASLYTDVYSLQAGDTLSGIAGRYGIPWEALAAANRLGEFNVLQIGQEIKVPGEDKVPSTVASETAGFIAKQGEAAAVADTTPLATNTTSTLGAALTDSYTIQAGDTLFAIAIRFKSDLDTLLSLNGMNENSILQLGQTIKVPGSTADGFIEAKPASTPQSRADSYTVRAGDTMYTIAIRFKVDLQTLLRINNMNENSLLQLGQTLQLR